MPHLVRFLLRHALIGVAIAIGVVGLLIGLDIGGIGHLIRNAEHGWLFAAVLTAALGLTFGSAQMGFAVMLLPQQDADDRSGGGPTHGHPAWVRRRAKIRRFDRD